MASDLQVGSVVQLKSGGPVMTVSFASKSKLGEYGCLWFLDGEIKAHTFNGNTLKVIKD